MNRSKRFIVRRSKRHHLQLFEASVFFLLLLDIPTHRRLVFVRSVADRAEVRVAGRDCRNVWPTAASGTASRRSPIVVAAATTAAAAAGAVDNYFPRSRRPKKLFDFSGCTHTHTA